MILGDGRPRGGPFSRDRDPVVVVSKTREEPAPAPSPTDVILARLEAMEAAQAARHAEVLARIEALEKSLAATVDDRTTSVSIDVERLQGRTREWVAQAVNEILDGIEGAPGA